MDPIRPNMGGRTTTTGTSKPATTIARRGPLMLLSVAAGAAGFALAYKYRQGAMRRNEQAQRESGGPNFYVSVDRSGGGI